MASNLKKKPPTTSSDGNESRRRREGAAAPRDAEIAPAGPQFAHMTVFVLPPNESCSNLVSFESRYGMCCDLPSTRADMTLPRADRDKLILVASFSRSPVACVFDCLSLPARSTRFSFPTVICSPVRTVPVLSQHSTMIVKMACERLEPAFMAVAPTLLFFLPACMTWSISCEDFTCAGRRGRSTRSERPQK